MKKRKKAAVAPPTAQSSDKSSDAGTKPTHPTHEQIQQRTQKIFLARGGAPGHELDDWFQSTPACERATRATVDK